jgi:hypothetical protein
MNATTRRLHLINMKATAASVQLDELREALDSFSEGCIAVDELLRKVVDSGLRGLDQIAVFNNTPEGLELAKMEAEDDAEIERRLATGHPRPLSLGD